MTKEDMSIINLTYPDKSDIKFESYQFPDGQQQIKISHAFGYESVKIKSRLNNWLDLEKIVCAIKSLQPLCSNIELDISYFLGARSDRKFERGANHYLKDVICPIINSLPLKSITVLDPHSDVLEACLNNFTKKTNELFVRWAINQIGENNVYLFPDAGASKKIDGLGLNGEIIVCSKQRDVSGKITKTEVPYFDLSKNVVIVDDICDGGATFNRIGEMIKLRHKEHTRDGHPFGKLYLCVTHGVFSKGFDELLKNFNEIYCTNSYQDISNPLVKQLKVI